MREDETKLAERTDSSSLAEGVFFDYLERVRLGEASDLDALCAEYPELEQELRGQARVHAWILTDMQDRLERAQPWEATFAALGARETHRRYETNEVVGSGGMGVVLQALDQDLDRVVALKRIREHVGDGVTPAQNPSLGRFFEEARVTGQLDHPGIVPVHDVGVDGDGRAFFTMKLVRGKTFAEMLHDGSGEWSRTRIVDALLRAAEAVAFAHSRGVVHRDLKPSNLMVGDFGETYVMDWGLAKEERGEEVNRSERAAAETMEGAILGTPSYMPPEQARGERVGPLADVYSLGAILYEVLAGKRPYAGVARDTGTLLQRIRETPPEPLSSKAAAPELVAICERAMAREPAERYPSVKQFAEDLRAYLEGRVVSTYESGAWAELRKWVQRNRALATSTAAAILALVLGLSGIAVVQKRANDDLSEASERVREANVATNLKNAALEDANREILKQRDRLSATNADLRKANETILSQNEALLAANEEVRVESAARERVISLLMNMFSQASPYVNRGRIPDAVEVLEIGARQLEEDEQDPRVAGMLGKQLSQAFEALGELERASDLAQAAENSFVEAFGADSAEAIEMNTMHVICLQMSGRLEEALEKGLVALERSRAALGSDHRVTGRLLGYNGFLMTEIGGAEEALPYLREAVAVLAAQPQEDSNFLQRCENEIYLARALLRSGQVDESRDVLARVCEELEGVEGESRRFLSAARTNFVEVLRFRNEHELALEVFQAVFDEHTRMFEEGHPRLVQDQVELALIHREASVAEGFAGRAAESARHLDESIRLLEEVYALQVEEEESPLLLAKTAIHLSRSLAAKGEHQGRVDLLAEHVDEIGEGGIPSSVPTSRAVLLEMAQALLELGEVDAADSFGWRLLELIEETPQPGNDDAWTRAYVHHLFAEIQERAGEFEEAAALWDEAKAIWASMGPAYDSGVRMARDNAARLRAKLGK